MTSQCEGDKPEAGIILLDHQAAISGPSAYLIYSTPNESPDLAKYSGLFVEVVYFRGAPVLVAGSGVLKHAFPTQHSGWREPPDLRQQ